VNPPAFSTTGRLHLLQLSSSADSTALRNASQSHQRSHHREHHYHLSYTWHDDQLVSAPSAGYSQRWRSVMMNFSGRNLSTTRVPHFLAMVCASCVLLSSCGSATKSLELAKQNVEQFHSQLDTEQYPAVYASADEKFHQVTSESDFTKILQAIHRKLGNVQQSSLRSMNVGWHTGQGETVSLVYDTTFAQGTGTEQFVWHVKDNDAALYGYHINSTDLISK
jgi:hypothetical protein